MTRKQAEQILLERRSKSYDPWVVDRFIAILDQLERAEVAALRAASGSEAAPLAGANPIQYEVISATSAEDREFNELKRDLARASSVIDAGDILFRHLKRIVPAAGLALYRRRADSTDLVVLVCSGVGSSALDGLIVPIGERISGWIFANAQPVLNSDATLELGPVAKTYPVPLRYATGVPVADRGEPVGVVMVFTPEPLDKDHKRLLENSATLFVSSVSQPLDGGQEPAQVDNPPKSQTPKTHVH
jgi:hypothetical protein